MSSVREAHSSTSIHSNPNLTFTLHSPTIADAPQQGGYPPQQPPQYAPPPQQYAQPPPQYAQPPPQQYAQPPPPQYSPQPPAANQMVVMSAQQQPSSTVVVVGGGGVKCIGCAREVNFEVDSGVSTTGWLCCLVWSLFATPIVGILCCCIFTEKKRVCPSCGANNGRL